MAINYEKRLSFAERFALVQGGFEHYQGAKSVLPCQSPERSALETNETHLNAKNDLPRLEERTKRFEFREDALQLFPRGRGQERIFVPARRAYARGAHDVVGSG